MKNLAVIFVCMGVLACGKNVSKEKIDWPKNGPIQLHVENPHYFLYKGQTMALVTSAEHYGAVLNLDFDYKKYLQTLNSDGMNYTRIFTGSYFEIYGQSFNIQYNTLGPKEASVTTPWEKVISASGETKYDLTKWNIAYFERLKDFLITASEYGIIVEVTLFSSIYNDSHWNICPQNPENNVNIEQTIDRKEAQTLNNGELLEYQDLFVRKIVGELNGFDNFFFEIQNEPWADRNLPVYNIANEELKKDVWKDRADFGDEASMKWQDKISSIIVDEEGKLEKKHLIAQNYTNFLAPIPIVSENISIINFHYAWPKAVEWNYHYNKVIGFDESGFSGTTDRVYRIQAWQFMLSGGGLFNNLDYSFYPGSENGLGENKAPGGGSKALRQQLKVLKEFLHSFQLEKLNPNPSMVKSSPGLIPFVLTDQNNACAIFLRAIGTKKTTLTLDMEDGNYKVGFLNTITGTYSDPLSISTKGGVLSLDLEIPNEELAIKITRE